MPLVVNLNRIFYTFIGVLATFSASAQTVSTFSNPVPAEIIAADPFGHVYSTTFDADSARPIHIINQFGSSWEFTPQQTGVRGMACDAHGNLFVSDFINGEIRKITPSGQVSVFLTGLDKPTALVFDSHGNLMVLSTGDEKVFSVNTNGDKTEHSSSVWYFDGNVMTIDGSDQLYIGYTNTGVITQVSTSGIPTDMCNIADGGFTGISGIAYSKGELYVTTPGKHRIYHISLLGDIHHYSGSGNPGFSDGNISQAEFDTPMGMAVSPTQDSLYIAEPATRVRLVIDLGAFTSVETEEEESSFNLFPNPFKEETNIQITNPKNEPVEAHVFDLHGRPVKQLIKTYSWSPLTSLSWDGTDQRGQRVSSGVYFIRIKLGDEITNKQLYFIP